MSLIIAIIIITTSIILLEISLNNHHTALAQQQENKSLVGAGVHSPEFEFRKNPDNMGNASQSRVTHPEMAAGMMENHTITTIKLDASKFQLLLCQLWPKIKLLLHLISVDLAILQNQ